MGKGKRIFSNGSLKCFLAIVIVLSLMLEALIIKESAMGMAAFLMWVPAFGALTAGCVSQREFVGRISVRRLFGELGFRKTAVGWLFLACVVPLAYIGIAYVLYWILFPSSLDPGGKSIFQLILMGIVGIFVGVLTALGEEIGWRGYFLKAVSERVGLTSGLVLTSVFWGCWHLPVLISGLYMPGTPLWYKVPAFMLMIIPAGMIFGIISIRARSVWPAVFLHAAHNNFDQIVFGPITSGPDKSFFVSETGLFTIICAWIILFIMYRKWIAE